MAVGLVVIAYAAWRIIAVFWYALRPTTTTDTTNAISLPNRLAKRAFEQDDVDTAMVDNDDNGGQVFQPMVSSFHLVRYGCVACHTQSSLNFFILDPWYHSSIITSWILSIGITCMWYIP